MKMGKGIEPSDDFKKKMLKHGKFSDKMHSNKDNNKGKVKPSKLFGKMKESE